MPPEQARGDPVQVGPASDVYSLGAILYHLLAGRAPYTERTPFETILKLLAPEPPPPPRTFRPEIPVGLEQICLRCLRKDQAQALPHGQRLRGRAAALFRTATPDQKRGPATMRPMALEGFLLMTWTKGQVPLAGGSIVIGRDPGCDLELPALTVSGRHCRILVDAEQHEVEVTDLGSAGGTLVNGQAVKRRRLQDGDQLDVGGYRFRVQLTRPKGAGGQSSKRLNKSHRGERRAHGEKTRELVCLSSLCVLRVLCGEIWVQGFSPEEAAAVTGRVRARPRRRRSAASNVADRRSRECRRFFQGRLEAVVQPVAQEAGEDLRPLVL